MTGTQLQPHMAVNWTQGTRRPPAGVVRRKPGFLFSVFAVLYLIGCYVNIPVGPVPMFSALPFAMIGLLIFMRRLLSPQFLGAVGIAGGAFLLSLLAPELLDFYKSRLVAFFQFIYSLIIGLTLYWTVTSFERRQAARFCNAALIVLLIGGALEVTTGLASVMDSLMSHFYSLGDYIEIVHNRDAGIGFGFRRPKFFTSETSYFSLAYCILVCALAWLSEAKGRYMRALVFGVLGVLLARSPIPILSMIFVGLLAVLDPSGKRTSARTAALATALVLAVPVMTGGYLALSTLFEARLQTISSGDDYSIIYRTYGSLYAALAVLAESPLFGVGIGSIDLAYIPLTTTYIDLGVPAVSVEQEWRFQVQNLPSALAIYTGMIGTMFYLVALFTYAKSLLRVVRWPTLFLFVMLSATEAAFYSPRFNMYLFLILAISTLAARKTLNYPNNYRLK